MTSDFPGAVPELPVADVAAAAAYYRDALGFGVDWIADDIDLAGVSRGQCRIFLAGPRFRKERSYPHPIVTWLNLSSKAEVDALYRAWQAAKAVLISAPESKPWGLHEFTAADPDGNRFRVFYDFATPERECAAGRA
ncbi:MAG: VOC family protein [Planctomycetota bacterium]|nr:VOC family protein [Planctomycetota bacterium]